MRGDADPETEGGRELEQPFVNAVAPLAEGNLTYPAPFDICTSAALAANIDTGDMAEKLFAVTALRQAGFHLTITAVAPGEPGLPEREIINTRTSSLHTLTVLLEDLLDELHERHQHDGKDPSGGQADH